MSLIRMMVDTLRTIGTTAIKRVAFLNRADYIFR